MDRAGIIDSGLKNMKLAESTQRNGRPSKDISAEIGQVLVVMNAYRDGDFSVRLPETWGGILGKLADTMNGILMVSARRADEITRVCR
ncbi:MAG TPA: hypothetical protein VK598_07925, partial [Nitrospiraceae bacterium]|nr:hypothetical protein [Nitrospiraceae bacterium]